MVRNLWNLPVLVLSLEMTRQTPTNLQPDFFQVHEQEPSNNHTSCHVVCPAACKAATEQVPRVIGGTE